MPIILNKTLVDFFTFYPSFSSPQVKLDYYYQKVNVRFALQVAEQLKQNLRKLGHFIKIPEMLGCDGECQPSKKANFNICPKNL